MRVAHLLLDQIAVIPVCHVEVRAARLGNERRLPATPYLIRDVDTGDERQVNELVASAYWWRGESGPKRRRSRRRIAAIERVLRGLLRRAVDDSAGKLRSLDVAVIVRDVDGPVVPQAEDAAREPKLVRVRAPLGKGRQVEAEVGVRAGAARATRSRW